GGAGETAAGETDGGAGGRFEPSSWDEAIQAAARATSGEGVVLLHEPVTGTTEQFFSDWATFLGATRFVWDGFDYGPLREAHRIAYGQPGVPSYELDAADRIVCFGAEFLETWLGPLELAARFAGAREIEEGRHAKFTFVGPRLSLTGMQADDWVAARAGTEGLVALAVAGVVAERRGVEELDGVLAGHTPERAAKAAGVEAEAIRRLGEELAAAEAPVALPPGVAAQGPGATEVHLAVALLNHALGAVGRTVRLEAGPVRPASASFAEARTLVEEMRSGRVRTLIVAGGNPAFTLPASSGFAEALGDVQTVISLSSHLDETASAADWVLPAHHPLESWGDADVRPGVIGLAQPVMQPVFDTRQREDILLQIAAARGSETFGVESFREYLKEAWRPVLGEGPGFEDRWREALRRGGVWGGGAPANGTGANGAAANGAGGGGTAASAGPGRPGRQAAPSLTAEARAYRFASEPAAGEPPGTALVVYPTLQFYDGRGANRSWMQELPDPVTQNVWNSWVELHPDRAGELGVRHGDVVEVRGGAGAVRAPAYLYPGIRRDAVAIPIGQGHTAYGRHAAGRGVNPLDLLPGETDETSGALAFAGTTVEVVATGERTLLAHTLGSDTDHGREIAELIQVEEARAAIAEHRVDLTELLEVAWDSDPRSPYRWGMTVDLNACIGCGACVTACYSENNVPTVGERQVAFGREMSWIRVQRLYEERADGGFETVHQPMLCQHCGDAPCEPVCPVYAAYHTPEGLNAQVYNRCVGTRYCANNCPYKVRRFNYYTSEWPYPLNLQLNPDVTVREKGVMEKCTFCVQRINRARIAAKEEGRTIRDGEVVTACMQSCPTQAIVFGNLKDPESRVSRLAHSARGYGALAELGTRPAVIYLEDVTHAELPAPEHG
ncbi:MAG: 4Fe-4S dicluster domain-containing protein, partial [Gemmatimonadota bacterium]